MTREALDELMDLFASIVKGFTAFCVTFGIVLGLTLGGCAARTMGLLPVKAAVKAVTK